MHGDLQFDHARQTAAAKSGRAAHLPADGFLPHLPLAVDGEAMRARLQSAMFGERSDPRVERCSIERVKYRPGQRCTIGYRLGIGTSGDGPLQDHFLTARLFEPDGAAARFDRYKVGRWIAPRFGPPLLLLADLDMILWSFPNDRHLQALPLLVDSKRLRQEVMPKLVERRFGQTWSIASMLFEMVSYVHERRCCVRVDLALARANGETRHWSVFGKTSGDDSDGNGTVRTLRIGDAPRLAGAGFCLPRSLGACPDHRTLWQEVVRGAPLAGGAGGLASEAAFSCAGCAIVRLHGGSREDLRRGGTGDAIGRLEERAAAIAAWPAYGLRIAPIVGHLLASVPMLDQGTLVAAHGDLHGRNILLDGDRVALIDLDEAIVDPPARDLGHFAAYTLFDEGENDRAGEAIRAFIDGYRAAAAWTVPTADIVWHAGACLITEKIFREVTLMQPDRRKKIERLIALADRLSRGDGRPLGLDIDAGD